MNNNAVLKEFNWQGELEKTMVNSLVTTFGLDFLFAEDKTGGDVDTIHNAREYQKQIKHDGYSDINLSEDLSEKIDLNGRNVDPYKKIQYDEQGNIKVDSKGKAIKKDDYHQKSKQYTNRKEQDRQKEDQGTMVDGYTGKQISSNDVKKSRNGEEYNYVTELDHVVAASEIHDDLGRILADIDGVSLANCDDNLVSTHWVINNAKSDHSLEDFFKEGGVRDKKVENFKNELTKKENELLCSDLSQPDKEKIKKEIQDLKKKKEILENLDEEKMKKIEKDARDKYNQKINWSYYTSSKFFTATAKDMHKKGLAMGARQAIGMVLAEVWFELRKQIPAIYKKHKNNFDFEIFLQDIAVSFQRIWEKIKKRFNDLLVTFKDSYIGGALSSLNTTLLNTFLTTQKMIGKMIRELWNSLIGVIKLIAFNPNRLAMGDLLREAFKLLGLGISALVGTLLHSHLAAILTIPFGEAISSFISALVTGIINLGFVYFLEHSEITQKIWNFLNQFKPKDTIEYGIEKMKQINAELDRYLTELTKIEFNLNTQELKAFSDSLTLSSNEFERNFILNQEIQRRNIELPYQSGNPNDIRRFLKSKCKN
ncbi:DNA repair protein [Pasteurellaceae bacterium 22721_9_1]